MKKIICLFITVMMCLGLSGCMGRIIYNIIMDSTTEDIYANIDFPKEVMGYLSELYPDDEFTFIGDLSGGSTSDMASFFRTDFEITSKKYDGRSFTVRLDTSGFNDDENRMANVKKHFYDDYFRLQWNDDANEFFGNILEECGINAMVMVQIFGNNRPEGVSSSASFEDYLWQSKVEIGLYVFSDEKIPHEQQLAFANKVAELENNYGIYSRHFYTPRADGTLTQNTRLVIRINFCLTQLSVSEMEVYKRYDELYSSKVDSIKTYGIYSDLEIKEFEERSIKR